MITTELQKNRAAIHGGLFVAAFAIGAVALPPLSWPWPLVLPVLVYVGIVLVVGPLRRTAPTLAIGRMGGWPLVCAAVLALATMRVLAGYQAMIRPDVRNLA